MSPKKLIHGVGINDADYVTQRFEGKGSTNGKRNWKLVWVCPFYRRWREMLKRCYYDGYHTTRPSYKDCTVCHEWIYFSKFKAWMEQQDWQDKVLDKDLLVKGNKVYSPETCVFISDVLNSFLADNKAKQGEWPMGVHFAKGKFQARCCVFNGQRKYLGAFDTPEEAHIVYLEFKNQMAKELAEFETDVRIIKALLNRYEVV